MKLAVMQPYFFPYLGFFQLIHAVDTFVVFDDVNYKNRSWISRNAILNKNVPQRITLSLEGASQNKLINQSSVCRDQKHLLATIKQQYKKAPQFTSVFPLVEMILTQQEQNLAQYLFFSLRVLCDYLDLRPVWHLSSSLNKDSTLPGQAKILAICEELGASHYINLPGGKELYNLQAFQDRAVQLSFIEPHAISYKQFAGYFVPQLSIIDVMMFNDRDQCSKLLQEYDLV